ncbi:MAG: hypothetical protein FWB76_07730 [Oscillospiraceae bacterium]|nr:hypothetical protein [Oscillospiraceae bacterium]
MPKNKKTKRESALRGAWLDNPVLVQAIGLTPAIIASTSLRMALWFSLVTVLHLLICEIVASLLLKKWQAWARTAVYFAIGIVLAFGAGVLLETWGGLFDQTELVLRAILPLVATSSIAAVRCERFAVYNDLRASARDAVVNAVGFTGVMLIMGLLREAFGHGTLFGVELTETLHIRGFWMPFGGFLLLGFLAAALKTVLQWANQRGITQGAEEAMEFCPEDRQERLEKIHHLLHVADEYEKGRKPQEEDPPEPESQPEEPLQTEPKPASAMLEPATSNFTREFPKLDDLTIEQLLAEFQGGARDE